MIELFGTGGCILLGVWALASVLVILKYATRTKVKLVFWDIWE
jgi:hypothetical protein